MADKGSAGPSDEAIKLDVVSQLRWNGKIDSSHVLVDVDAGKVVLSGKVLNCMAKAEAEKSARQASGVQDVDNRLEVKMKEGAGEISDDELASRVNQSLRWDSDLADSDVRAVAQNGVVELEGTVDHHWKTTRARQLAEGFRGVAEVKDNLAVVPSHEPGDEALASQIAEALERNVLVDEDKIRVQVDDGVATLTGSVASWAEANEVRETASATPGVVDIHERLETKG